MRRLAVLLCLALGWASPAFALKLERVVLVERHGVRPPTSSNAELAKYAAQPWPVWPAPPGELTDHGAAGVRLMGQSLRAAYRRDGLLPAAGCPASGKVVVWADGTDERTRRTGQVLAAVLAPGCGIAAAWAAPKPRDPIFGGPLAPDCRIEGAAGRAAILAAAGPASVATPATNAALARLQAILAPAACQGGAGMCLAAKQGTEGAIFVGASLAEDLLLEYAQGLPAADVGWGRAASEARIAQVMALHERVISLMRRSTALSAHDGAPMARLILAALAGEAGPHSGPDVRLLALAGHDTNLTLMAGVFGLDWRLDGQPDATAPAAALAFELWSDHGQRFVRPVIWYETLDQLRTLAPAAARGLPLSFAGCDSGPMGSCPLSTLARRAAALIPPACAGDPTG